MIHRITNFIPFNSETITSFNTRSELIAANSRDVIELEGYWEIEGKEDYDMVSALVVGKVPKKFGEFLTLIDPDTGEKYLAHLETVFPTIIPYM